MSLIVHGDERMMAFVEIAVGGHADMVTSPMTLVEAYDGKITERRWDWALSRIQVNKIGKEEARAARRLLAETKLHGHQYAVDAVLAVIARRLKGDVTIFTSDVEDLKLLAPGISIRRV
nr:hypothetical protein [Nocardiopsis mwathae]